jgi:hypothetical protein
MTWPPALWTASETSPMRPRLPPPYTRSIFRATWSTEDAMCVQIITDTSLTNQQTNCPTCYATHQLPAELDGGVPVAAPLPGAAPAEHAHPPESILPAGCGSSHSESIRAALVKKGSTQLQPVGPCHIDHASMCTLGLVTTSLTFALSRTRAIKITGLKR